MRHIPLAALTLTAALLVAPTPAAAAPVAALPTASLAAETAPTGFASVNALGLNGTTGGAGGRVVTVTTTDALQTAIDSKETLVIQV